MDSAQDQLIQALLKAISRTSILAEGNNPELDALLQSLRANVARTQDPQVLQRDLQAIEPYVLKFDDERLAHAQAFRNQLFDLLDSLDQIPGKQVPLQRKKLVQADIRSHWQSISQWPTLLGQTVELLNSTLSQDTNSTKPSFLGRLFGKKTERPALTSDNDIMAHVSHTLAGLLSDIALPDTYEEQILDIKQALTGNSNLHHLPALLDEVINLIMVAVGKTQADLTSYLNQLNDQLASINASIVTNYKAQRGMSSTRKDFNETLQDHVTNTHTDVRNATNLDSLKGLIDERMHTITEAMKQYQSKMLAQEKQAAQSIHHLKNKVSKMEHDAATLRTHMQQKAAQALADSLTGLPNRAAYQETIFPLLTSAAQNQLPLCVAVCDIDHFKNINDTWGHLAGDKVLRLIPRQIQAELKKEHVMFRYGGEEFVIVFPMTDLEKAYAICERVRQAVEKTPFNVHGEPISVSISIGVAQFNYVESHDDLFSRADKHLYQAKGQGRNQVIRDN
ncbi:GGDEF domain-containing protein [Marinomonas ostreistagni]|uniref:GGDEF domain-containing protein n=1 Tax=Marinomonas ostreistagni TaxID=359209 RepID=UPI0019516E25|nr:GGDEF domain-containing protein [Marinomonas ostreistagni]MBM6552244.1 GGDEF domain-containing protein [Marinomonas ostreistagni]